MLDLKFLHGCAQPTVALLVEDFSSRKVHTYVVDVRALPRASAGSLGHAAGVSLLLHRWCSADAGSQSGEGPVDANGRHCPADRFAAGRYVLQRDAMASPFLPRLVDFFCLLPFFFAAVPGEPQGALLLAETSVSFVGSDRQLTCTVPSALPGAATCLDGAGKLFLYGWYPSSARSLGRKQGGAGSTPLPNPGHQQAIIEGACTCLSWNATPLKR